MKTRASTRAGSDGRDQNDDGVSRPKFAAAFGIVGVGLAVASTAYACTVYKGDLTANGNGAGSIQQTVSVYADGLANLVDEPHARIRHGEALYVIDTARRTGVIAPRQKLSASGWCTGR